MSIAYYRLYERKIKRHDSTEEYLTEVIDDAHEKGRLTDKEYLDLIDLIAQVYA